MPPYLDQEQFDAVYRAAQEAGLMDNRRAVFTNVPVSYYGNFPHGGGPAGQLLIDLGQLNGQRPLLDGSIPLRTWLRNALLLARDTESGATFEKALRTVDRQIVGAAADVSGALAWWDKDELRNLVSHRLSERAAGLGATAGDSLAVVQAASGGQWLDHLLVAALAQRFGDEKLVTLATERGLLPAVGTLKSQALQRMVKQRTPFTDVAKWRATLARAEVTIARVEMRKNGMWKPGGTAFLVGPDLVMTNHHVVESLLKKDDVTEELRFRFDFKRTTDGAKLLEGTLVKPAADWLLTHAPPSAVDALADPGAQLPAQGELDFAVIRLASKVGELPVGATDSGIVGKERGWLRPSRDTSLDLLGPGENVFILQHPEGDALQIAAGTFLDVTPLRARYDTNTAPGSSGSPCLDARLALVALHHGGDPNVAALHRPTYNEGIPMHLIVALCEEDGLTFPAPP